MPVLDRLGELGRGLGGQRVDQRLPAGEAAVHGGAGDPGGLRDLLHGRARVLGQDAFGRREDRADTAFGVGAQRAPGRAVHLCASSSGVPGNGTAGDRLAC